MTVDRSTKTLRHANRLLETAKHRIEKSRERVALAARSLSRGTGVPIEPGSEDTDSSESLCANLSYPRAS